jgi:hypothetical protein
MSIKKVTQELKSEVISTQHYIKINDDELDVIFDFSIMNLQVHLNGSLIYSRTFQPNRVGLNYLNVLEVTIYIYSNYIKSIKKKLESEQSSDIN